MQNFRDIWVYLSASPLLHLTLTLLAFQVANWVHSRGRRSTLLNPVLLAVVMVVAYLQISDTSYAQYFDGAQFVHFLLGPATVALAIPLYRQFNRVRRSALALIVSIVCGSLTAIVSAIGIGYLLDASRDTLIAMAPKSVTAPVAMGIAEQLGGLPSLTVVLVLLTGILGSMIGPGLLTAVRVRDPAARGVAMGTAAHGIGTARAIQESDATGAFSGLAMGLNAIATAVLLPVLWGWLVAG